MLALLARKAESEVHGQHSRLTMECAALGLLHHGRWRQAGCCFTAVTVWVIVRQHLCHLYK